MEVIGIVSPKGGVGKTTIASNLAIALKNYFGQDVLVVDANLHTANLALYLGMYDLPISFNDILKTKINVSKAIYTHESGIHILPATLGIEEDEHLISASLFRKVISEVGVDYDYIIIDAVAGLSSEVKAAISVCDKIFVVVTPDIPTVYTSKKAIHLADSLNVISEVIVNKKTKNLHELKLHQISDILRSEVVASFNFDIKTVESVAKRVPAIYHSVYFREKIAFLAANIAGIPIKKSKIPFINQLRKIKPQSKKSHQYAHTSITRQFKKDSYPSLRKDKLY